MASIIKACTLSSASEKKELHKKPTHTPKALILRKRSLFVPSVSHTNEHFFSRLSLKKLCMHEESFKASPKNIFYAKFLRYKEKKMLVISLNGLSLTSSASCLIESEYCKVFVESFGCVQRGSLASTRACHCHSASSCEVEKKIKKCQKLEFTLQLTHNSNLPRGTSSN